MYDILIKNGLVVDGSGAPGFLADVALKDGRIAAIGAGLSTAKPGKRSTPVARWSRPASSTPTPTSTSSCSGTGPLNRLWSMA